MHASPSGTPIAFFDFDHTLIEGESFWAFLGAVAGWPKTGAAFGEALLMYGSKRLDAKTKNEAADKADFAEHRTFIKTHLLNRLLRGRAVESFAPAVERLRGWMTWKDQTHKALLDHHAQGHHIVIASGGLDLYLPELLGELPHDGLICTEIGVMDGVVSGEMVNGNCVRYRKAELVSEYLKANGPFGESWGYGNMPHDLPMLNLLKHRIIV